MSHLSVHFKESAMSHLYDDDQARLHDYDDAFDLACAQIEHVDCCMEAAHEGRAFCMDRLPEYADDDVPALARWCIVHGRLEAHVEAYYADMVFSDDIPF